MKREILYTLLTISISGNIYQYIAKPDSYFPSSLTKAIRSFETQGATTRSFTVIGEFDHLLTYKEKKGVVDSIWGAVGCREVDGIMTDTHINVCSEAAGLPVSTMASGRKVSLNLALRDDLITQKTVIAMASPVIINEY